MRIAAPGRNQSPERRVVVALRERARRTLTFVVKREAMGVDIARAVVEPGSKLSADEATHWDALEASFLNAGRINHSMPYADGDDHTNNVESDFARLRRMVGGQHHHVSARYLFQYAAEAAWKEGHRRMANGALFARTVRLAMRSPVSRVWKEYWQRAA